MKEQRLGIATSLAIHSGLLFLFLMIPAANVIPYTKTFYISFTQQEASPIRNEETKKITRSVPKQEEMQTVRKPEVIENKQLHDEVIVNDKPPVAVAVQKAENLKPAQMAVASLEKAGNQTIVETTFGSRGAPAFIHREIPVYPLLAQRFGKEGKVVLKLFIDKSGVLQNIEVIEPSGFGFTEAAVEAIKKSSFSPAHRNGEKIPSKAILSVRFNLK